MKEHISDIIKQDFKNWNKGDLIFITSGTGTGKTYFIKNELKEHCKQTKQNILYLTNRNNLRNQIIEDIKGNDKTITVMNYQKIESLLLNNISFSNYDYVIMDEGHYFFTDASFSRKTDLFFKKMLEDNSIIKIIMTATPRIILHYFSDKNITINYKYELKTDYSYLNNIIAFDNYESIDSIIENIPENEQILFFSSAKRAYEISKKFKGSFICSTYNNTYSKYINTEELDNIIKNGEFKNHLLCCTTAMDNGINIKENTPVKHIILDIFDCDEFIQCLGRKRITEGEKVNLYFYSWKDNKRINGFKKRIVDSLERANILITQGQNEYVKYKFKNDHFYDSRIIDEVIINDNIQKVVNECIYIKYKIDLLIYNILLNKDNRASYKSMIAVNLGINKEEISEMEITHKRYSLEEALESVIGERLYKEQQKEVVEFIGLKDARGRLQKSVSLLNAYLQENKLQYIIISKRIKEDNKLTTIWIIEKLLIENN